MKEESNVRTFLGTRNKLKRLTESEELGDNAADMPESSFGISDRTTKMQYQDARSINFCERKAG